MSTKPPTKTDETTAEKKPRELQAAPPTFVAYRVDVDGDIVDVVPFGTRKVDRETSKDYALEHGWKVATVPAGVSVREHIAGGKA